MKTADGKEYYGLGLDLTKFNRDIEQANRAFNSIGDTAEKEGSRVDNAFDRLGRKVAGAFAVGSLVEFERKIISVRSEMESLQISFETLAGKQLGRQLYNDIKQFAATTPMMMGDLAKGAQTLLGFNIEAEKVMPILREIGDISMGDAQKFNSLTLAFAQMSSTGKLMGQDLLQMINAGFNPLVVIAEKTGKSVAELKDEMSKGKISVEMVEDAFRSAASEGGKFNGMLQQQAKGMKGAIAQMEGAIQNTLNDFGEAQEGVLVDGIHLVTTAIEHYEEIGKVILTVAAAYGSWKAAQMMVVAYQNVIAQNTAAIEAQRVSSLEAIAAEYNAENAETAAVEANTAAKAGNTAAIDAEIAAIGRALQAKLAEAETNLANAETESLLAANRLAEAQRSVRVYEQQYEAALRLGDGEKIEAAENALNTAVSTENAAAKTAQAAADNVATASKAKEAAATQLSSFQTKVDTVSKQANTAATGLWAAATRAATAAMNGLKAAMASNPFGLALVAITSIIGLLSLFASETDEATEAIDKLRNAVMEDTSKLNTYRAVLDTVDKKSKQYTETLSKVNEMASEYHTSLLTENDTVEEQKRKYDELTEAIKAVAAQKLLAEAANKANTDAMESEKKAMDKLIEKAKEASHTKIELTSIDAGDGKFIQGYGAVEKASQNIRNITTATWNEISRELMSLSRDFAAAANQGEEAYKNAVDKEVEHIEKLLKALGVTDDELEEFHDDLHDYVQSTADGFQTAYRELGRSEAQLEGLANAAVDAKDVTNDAIDQMDYEQLQDELKKVQKEIDDINSKPAEIQVNDARLKSLRDLLVQINNLIPKQLTKGSDAELERRLKQLKDDRDALVYGSAEWKAKNAEVATVSRTLNSHKKGYAENAQRTDSSADSAAHRAAEEKKKQQEFLDLQKELADERKRNEFDLWAETEQAAIDAMREGSAKTLRQIELDFAQRKEELRRQYIEIRRQKFEEDKRLWEADPKHKNTPFTGKIEDAKYNLTSKELEQLRQQEAAAVQAHAKALEDIERQNTQHLNEYLRQYGSYQDQRAAIDREYAQKIADADSAIQKRALEAERDRLKSELDLKALQDNINWEDIFNNIDSHTTVYLKAIKDKLRAALNAKDITAENAKVIAEKIREIENTIADKQDIFGSLLPGLRERKRLTEEALRAEQVLNAAIQKQMAASMKVFSDQFAIQKKLAEAEITVSLQDINEENKEQLLSSLDKGSDLYKGLLQLFQNLAADTSAKNKSDEEVSKKQSRKQEVNDLLKGKGALTDIFSFGSGSPIEIIEGINANAQSMRDLVSDFRLDNTDFGKAVNNFADGCASFNNVVQDLLSGNVFGAVHDVLNGIGSWAQIFYAGGNEKEMEAEIAKLAKANETLAAAIDSLSERIADSDATNSQSVEAYRKSIEAEKQWEENQRKAIDDRASEWTNTGYGFLGMGGKGSFNSHMAGNDWAGWQAFTKVLRDNGINKSVNRENIWTLSPEEMKLLRDFAPKEWQALFNGDGHRNPEELVNEYIERAGMQDMLTSALNKKLTGYDWEGFKSTYSNLLKDLTSDNKKFADNLEDMLSSAILESLVNEQYKDRINDIYGMIADAASDGTFDEDELRKIREANDKLSADILRDRQALIDAGIIIPGTDSNTTDQSSTKKGYATASQDSIDELNGRFAGLMMIEEEAKNILITSSADIAIIREFESQHISIAEEIRNLAVLMVSHLEDIKTYTKRLISIDEAVQYFKDKIN